MFSFKAFGKEKCKRKKNNGDKLLKLRITNNIEYFEILEEMLSMMKMFIEERYLKMVCFAMKRGFFQDLHLQMICMIYISNLVERTLQFEIFVNTNLGLRLKENILLEN
jgi:hypothetical protein